MYFASSLNTLKMSTPSEIGERIRMSRARQRFSQQEVADLAQIAPAQFYRYEAGRTKPRPAMADRLAEALGVSTQWLLTGDGPMERDPNDDTGLRDESNFHVITVEFTPNEAKEFRRHARARGMTPEQLMKLAMYQQFEKYSQLNADENPPSAPEPPEQE
ncbi:helix-turn-helix domain-containing protein [Massilia sp. NP310]|uniref:helix-turn-helix domain-containing protein n=1 Tax=Massilia sp. NP310 TaxID=2861282 RepID=UPI001C62AD44|nr:helix-turn-helix transcriptional regulator [Massilia sp. NP310]QYG01880.1 helix-turn-helix domain-containing protein [Massilia sp. NP310]